MTTTAEKQAMRFRATPCPAKVSRKKLRQLMPLNHRNLTGKALLDSDNPFYMPGRRRGAGHFAHHHKQPTFDQGNNFMVFLDVVKSLGGQLWDIVHDDKKKVHTGGRREMRGKR